ncbi:MAG TPA: virulence protein RhuM/Fic/DOC family protein [bacterium]|nr:virulence protein RhuM/Fic/DOC family protein [bacterium]
MESNIILYTTEDGNTAVDVMLENDTVWLTQKQMSELFDKNRKTITEHINNVFKEGELDKNSVCRKFQHTAEDYKKYNTQFYNLDVIISVGYRVKSNRGTQFRIWASRILKDFLVKGYAVNRKKLEIEVEKRLELQKTIALLENTVVNQQVQLDQAKELIKVVSDFSYGLSILDDYDHQSVKISNVTEGRCYLLEYNEATMIVAEMAKKFNTGLFGNEKDESFKGALGNIYQTFDGKELYPSIEEKAANLLYFIVKDHAFSDGNKRIAAAMFIYFLDRNRILYSQNGTKRIADNALAAITLMIAESKPQDKDIIVKIVTNLINHKN